MSLNPTVDFWDPMRKKNLTYFKDVGCTVQSKVKGHLTSIQQERKLLSHLLVAAKCRPEFVTQDAVGEYEFNVAPPSNFNPE